ncbi:MAG: flavodoxin domain-containing protein [Bacteroidales bacterium]|nr:flavodoxin domain-containing protein [Bacteroidales bacterium]MDD4217398.1 flavodoxin domain-containing protein [Bacteroidales bacterium]MDY0141995.1 flavodoxin domain-containing protein [Bacteroidales bacterium]
MKTIVYYYSNKGSNRFLAKRIAKDISCEIEEIKPRLNAHLLMMMGINLGNRKLKSNCEDYERVILCGPIWMGKLIVPLKNFIRNNILKINNLVFVSCCGSTFDKKDEKFGHNLVFNEVKKLSGEKCKHCEAFPIVLVLPTELRDDSSAFMKTHLNDQNFKGEMLDIYNEFIINLS